MTTFTAALVQMRSSTNVEENIDTVTALIREAVGRGAHYIQTPEMTSVLNRDRENLIAEVGTEASDGSLKILRALADEYQVWLHIGSLAIRQENSPKLVNRSYLIAPNGHIQAFYDKIHMFDVDLPHGESWRESEGYQPGDKAVVAALPWGALGMGICYDLRFPILAHTLAQKGAAFLSYPSAFTRQTGEAHWHVLLRARAIETGAFVFAAAQGGKHADGRETYGHSLIVNPWGEVLAEGGLQQEVVMAEIDPMAVNLARQRIPALRNSRPFTLPE